MQKAQEAQRAGRAEEAANLYQAALRVQPHSAPAEYGLGLAATIQNHYQEAVERFTQALHDDPSLVDAYLFRGVALLNLQHPGQALTSLEHFYRLRPDDPGIRFYLGGTYNALENYPEAAKYYMAQIEMTPGRIELWYYLGECVLNIPRQIKTDLSNAGAKGEYALTMLEAEEEAETHGTQSGESTLREAIKAHPALPEAYVHLGNLFLIDGKTAEANLQFQEALRRAPQNCRALEGLGDVELANGNLPASLTKYAKVAEAPDACIEEPVPANLGLSRKEFSERLQSLSRYRSTAQWSAAANFELSRLNGAFSGAATRETEGVVNHSPGQNTPGDAEDSRSCPARVPHREWLTSPELELFRSNRFENRGELSCAVNALSAFESHLGGGLESAYWVFRLYMWVAQRVLTELADRSPQSYLVSEVRAEALELQGDDAEAGKEYRNAIAASGNDPDPRIEFGRFKCKLRDPDDAIAALKEALLMAPYNTRANDLMGEALFMREDYAGAIPYLQSVLRSEPGNEPTRIRLGESLAKVGRLKEAAITLEAAPSDPDGRIHYVLAGYYRREGRKDEMQRALAYFQAHQNAQHSKAADPN